MVPALQREAPVLSELAAKYKGKVNFIGVDGSPNAIDGTSPESQSDVYLWSQKFGASYPVAFDPNLDVAHKYLEGGFPTVVLIGGDARCNRSASGRDAASDVSNNLDAMLAARSPIQSSASRAELYGTRSSRSR